MVRRDYYSVLGISPSASDEEIKKAYRRLAMESHPDRNPGDPKGEERFKEINEAYAVLGVPQKRREHDRSHRTYQKPYWSEDVLRDFDFLSIFREFGQRFDDEIQERFFCPGRRGGCGRRRARLFRRRFAETSSGFHTNPVHDLFLSPIEASVGTQREVLVKRGLEYKRYLIRIPAGVSNGTLIRVPMENQGKDGELYLRVRLVHG